jgi:hypothetical protein
MFDGIGLFSRFQPTENERMAPDFVLLTAVSNTADLRQQYPNSSSKHIRCDVNQPKKQPFTITD